MRKTFLAVSLLLGAWMIAGRTPAAGQAPAAAGPLKIGVVNTSRVMTESAEGRALQKELEAKFGPRQKDLQMKAAEIDRLQGELQAKQASMTDVERQRRAIEIQQKQTALKRINEDVTAEFDAAREESVGRLAKRVSDIVQKYGAEKQYSVIFDAGQAGALYGGSGADLTNEVLAAYNAAHPSK